MSKNIQLNIINPIILNNNLFLILLKINTIKVG